MRDLASPVIALGALLLGLGGCEAGFDASPFCRADQAPAADLHLLPLPAQVLQVGDPVEIAPATLSWEGEPADEPDVRAFAARAGLTVTSGAGGFHLVLHPAERWTPLVAACGLPGEDNSEAYYLLVEPEGGQVVAHAFAPAAPGRWLALQTLVQLVEGPGARVRAAAIFDRPAASLRGVIEGFYGEPWTQAARLEMLAWMAAHKLNTYLYAPKGDFSITLGWMSDFSAEELERMAEVVAEASRQHVRVCWQLHPSFYLVYSRQAHFDLVRAKLQVMLDQGIRCLALAFDDTDRALWDEDLERYATLGEAQVDFANRLSASLLAEAPDLMLGFVPHAYYTEAGSAAEDLPTLGQGLGPEWSLAWTGPQIVSRAITVADVEAITALLGRPPFLGDNYPVSDMAGSGEIHLGPLTGRAPEVPGLTWGFVANPMELARASQPALLSVADFAWNPAGYDPERALRSAAHRLAGGDAAGAAALEALCRANRSPELVASAAPELDAAVQAFWEAFEAGAGLEAADDALRAEFFEPYAAAPATLAASAAEPALLAELAPWSDQLAALGQAGLEALELLRVEAAGGTPDPVAVAALQAEIAALAERPARPTRDVLPGFLARALAELTAP